MDRGIPFRQRSSPQTGLSGLLTSMFGRQQDEAPRRMKTPSFPEESNKDYTDRDLDVVAKTAYGEARGEGEEGLRAVLHVIRNRKLQGDDTSYSEIAMAPRQFSVWNPDDPNRDLIEGLGPEDEGYANTIDLAREVLSGEDEDPTGGATHYFANTLPRAPRWASNMKPTATIGRHRFFRED